MWECLSGIFLSLAFYCQSALIPHFVHDLLNVLQFRLYLKEVGMGVYIKEMSYDNEVDMSWDARYTIMASFWQYL